MHDSIILKSFIFVSLWSVLQIPFNYFHILSIKIINCMEQTQLCQNCKKDIPASKTATHFGYCRRNIIKCSTCGEMYDKNFVQDHEEQFHLTIKCIHCSKMLKKNDVSNHNKICEMQPKYCEYCQLKVPLKDFNIHFKQCQSRTKPCEICQKSIMNKEFAIHIATCKGKPKPVKKDNRQTKNNQTSYYNFQDSLSEFQQLNNKQQQKKFNKNKEKQLPFMKKEIKKQSSKKEYNQVKPSPKKEITDPKNLSRQHFYDNYLNPSPNKFQDFDYDPYDFQSNYNDNNYQDNIDYLPQQSFYGKKPFDFQTPSTFEYLNRQPSDIQTEEQLMQETILESSKKSVSRHYKESLPEDFHSEDLMNKSFYKDILDIEKQKAILEDLGKNKPTKNNNKPNNIKQSTTTQKATKIQKPANSKIQKKK